MVMPRAEDVIHTYRKSRKSAKEPSSATEGRQLGLSLTGREKHRRQLRWRPVSRHESLRSGSERTASKPRYAPFPICGCTIELPGPIVRLDTKPWRGDPAGQLSTSDGAASSLGYSFWMQLQGSKWTQQQRSFHLKFAGLSWHGLGPISPVGMPQ